MRDFTFFTSIAVSGSIAFDEIMNFPKKFKDHFHRDKLHQINISFVVDRLEKNFGGTATNIAYNASKISKKKVSVLGAMGKDHNAITSFFNKHNIDFSGSIIDLNLYTSTGKVITDICDNQIWGYYYGAGIKGNKIQFSKYANKKTFFIISANHEKAFLHVQKYCIKNKRSYLYDPGMSLTFITNDDLAAGIKSSLYCVGNDYEIAQIEKRLGVKILDIMAENSGLITTLGAKGVKYESRSQEFIVQAYKSKSIKDPTGAGDAWRGGFIASLLDGRTIYESLKYGNALASFAIEKYGTVNHNPEMSDIAKRVKVIK